MSIRTNLIRDLKALRARGISIDSPEWNQVIAHYDTRRRTNPGPTGPALLRILSRTREDLKQFLPEPMNAE